MSVATSNYLEAIAHLPSGLSLCGAGVPWQEYEQLLEDLGDDYAGRLFYHQGQLEIIPPRNVLDTARPIIYSFIVALSEELNIEISSVGATTLKRRLRDAGAEPDDAFYISDIAPALGTRNLDLEHDPPPHLVLEIDRTSLSLDRFRIYAALGVPEIWRLYRGTVTFHHLQQENYVTQTHSRAFPLLSSATLTDFLAQGLREGETRAARAFRAWVQGQLLSNVD